MRTTATIVASLAAAAVAAPAPAPAAPITDATILTYALTLEHLENAFYREALQKFTKEDFMKYGLPASFYNNLKEISYDEKTHVDFLVKGLTAAGADPVAECKYNFGANDVGTFLAIANVLEGVGISAYLGAAPKIVNKDYLTAAATILTVEARHSSYLRTFQKPVLSPFPAPFDIPLGFSDVFSLAAPFFVSCPAGKSTSIDGTTLPFKAFPSIAVSPAGPQKIGAKLKFSIAKPVDAKAAWFITSAGPVRATLSGSGDCYYVIVPKAAQPGQAYVVLTTDEKAPTDDNTCAGPAVFQKADNAYGFSN